jgi:predicted lipoprotein with Yx(FWY)xxD motif
MAVVLVLAAGLLAGCGGDDDDDAPPAGTVQPGSTPIVSGTAAGSPIPGEITPVAGGSAVQVGTANGAPALTDSQGLTLYTSSNDPTGSSVCVASCTMIWPPLIVTGDVVAPAGAGGTLSTITRDDGSSQAAYNGAPLYRYANDTAPGQAAGDGLGGVWFIAKP